LDNVCLCRLKAENFLQQGAGLADKNHTPETTKMPPVMVRKLSKVDSLHESNTDTSKKISLDTGFSL
jgi:hypothetical protein